MGKIRSAWEIALEKTEGISVDKEKIAYKESVDKARLYAGKYINDDDEDATLEKTMDELKKLADQKAMKEGVTMTIIQNLNLPMDEVLTDRFERIQALADFVSASNENVNQLMSQLVGFIKQYPLHKKQLLDGLKEQYAPSLRQKEAQLKAQYGQDIELQPEQDQEFLKLAQQNLDKLSEQYNQTLEGAKAQLKELLA